MRKVAAVLLLTGLTSACATVDVRLTVKNPEAYPQIVSVEVLDPEGGTKKRFPPQTVGANSYGEVEPFSVKEGGGYRLLSAVPGSATVFSQKREILDAGEKVRETIELRHRAGTYLDDPQAIYDLTVAFKKNLPDAGSYPIDLQSALKTKLKGLVLFDGAESMLEMMSLTPAQFGSGEVGMKDTDFRGATASGEVIISGSALSDVSRNIPLYRAFGFSTRKNAIYRLGWLIEGAGATALPSRDEDLLSAFDQLSDTVKLQLNDILTANRGAVVYYLDQAYLARLVRLSLQKGRLLREGEEIGPGDVIASAGVFSFEGEEKEVKAYRDVVLNFYGGEIAVQTVLKGADRTSAAAAGAPFPAVTFEVTGYPTGKRKVILPDYLRVTPATVTIRTE